MPRKSNFVMKKSKKELRQSIVCEWLNTHYLQHGYLRHDVITDRLQIWDSKPTPNPSLNGGELSPRTHSFPLGDATLWRNLTDKDINTMVCDCVHQTEVNVSVTEMWTALKSDLVPSVHPIREWLNQLHPYSSAEPDWIDMVAQKVKVKPYSHSDGLEDGSAYSLEVKDKEASDAFWRTCFKKWFVAMVASWMKDEVVNHTVLVLVGRQGIYKTTWLDRLIPPELREYSSKMPLSGQITKDDRLRLCENAMLNIDELDAISGREMNIVKSLLTSSDVNERAAYGRLKERRVRLASFCASTNNREFLTDITGNRRWLPFEVESIQNPFNDLILYDRLYAQAKAYVECGYFAYWFDMEEMQVLEKHNEEFRAMENEEQLLPILFDVPAEGKGKFMTTAEISDRLVTYGGIKKPMNVRRLGTILGKNKYKDVTRRIGGVKTRGWIVYQRDTQEIDAMKRLLAK